MAAVPHRTSVRTHNSSVSNGRMHAMLQVPYYSGGEETKGRKDRKKMGPKSRVYSALYNNTHLHALEGQHIDTSLGAQKTLSDTLYIEHFQSTFETHQIFQLPLILQRGM